MEPKIIEREELSILLETEPDLVVAEVLGPATFAEGHLPTAIHMPLDGVAAVAKARIPDRDTTVVLYCASTTCQNSHIAARALVALGYTDVAVFAGGKAAWREAGLPLVTTEAA